MLYTVENVSLNECPSQKEGKLFGSAIKMWVKPVPQ